MDRPRSKTLAKALSLRLVVNFQFGRGLRSDLNQAFIIQDFRADSGHCTGLTPVKGMGNLEE